MGKKSKSISSPEQNYVTHFAMRYPVVRSGALYKNGKGYETRKVRKIIKPFGGHFEFNDKKLDFVILELKGPFTLIKGFVQPACLPSKQLKKGDICFASGWGYTSMDHRLDHPNPVLRAAKMKIKTPLQHCSKGIFLLFKWVDFYCLTGVYADLPKRRAG